MSKRGTRGIFFNDHVEKVLNLHYAEILTTAHADGNRTSLFFLIPNNEDVRNLLAGSIREFYS